MLIEKVTRPTDELLLGLQRLIPQLGKHKVPPTAEELAVLIGSEGCTLLVARDPEADGRIIGTLCLNVYRVPTGVRSIVEDVVVDESARRQGVGEALMRRALDLAREAGASGLSLTSRPEREAANRLYQSMGFELRKTNAYIHTLT
jgi:ribosomal protein S18 acetylase RimI-like enzyme